MKDRYYIKSKGKLYRDKDTLRFKNDNTDTRLPVERVYDIFAEEGVTLTSGVLELLSDKEILLHSFDHYGNYVGTFTPKEAVMSGECVVNQAKHYNINSKRIRLARKFVEGSVENMRLTLLRYSDGCCDAPSKLKDKREEISSIDDIPSLMQLEGSCRDIYYTCLDHQINKFSFDERQKQPPVGEINAMISYLNSMIYAATVSELYKTRLDQKISFLHEPRERRYSLSLDISEIFKPSVADRIIVSMVNQNEISSEDFHTKGKGTFLDDDGREKVIDSFRNKMTDTRKHPDTKKNHSMRRWIRMECHKITKHVLGAEEYDPLTLR